MMQDLRRTGENFRRLTKVKRIQGLNNIKSKRT